jgi:hypothetical protein
MDFSFLFSETLLLSLLISVFSFQRFSFCPDKFQCFSVSAFSIF